MNRDLPAGRQVGMIEGMNTDLSASQILLATNYTNDTNELNSEQKPEECDATDDDSSTEAG